MLIVNKPMFTSSWQPASLRWRLPSLRVGRSYRLHVWTQRSRKSFEIKDPADQITLLPDTVEPSPAEAPQPMPVFAFPEELFDLLPRALRQLVAEPPHAHPHAGVRGLGATRLDRDMGRDLAPQQRRDEGLREEALVGAERGRGEAPAVVRLVEHRQAAAGFRCCRTIHIRLQAEQDAVAILHDRRHGVAGVGAGARLPLRDVAT